MRDLKTAQLLMHKARNDCAALEHMTDADKFSEEIFGFHAQQAVEKGLKAPNAGGRSRGRRNAISRAIALRNAIS